MPPLGPRLSPGAAVQRAIARRKKTKKTTPAKKAVLPSVRPDAGYDARAKKAREEEAVATLHAPEREKRRQQAVKVVRKLRAKQPATQRMTELDSIAADLEMAGPRYQRALAEAEAAGKKYRSALETVKRRTAGTGAHDFKTKGKDKQGREIIEYKEQKRLRPDVKVRRVVNKTGDLERAKRSIGGIIKGGAGEGLVETGGLIKKLTPKPLRKPAGTAGLKALEVLSVPAHAAGGLAQGKSVGEGVRKKLTVGAPVKRKLTPLIGKGAASVVGDVTTLVADPLNLVSGGTAGVARKGAEEAAAKMVREASEKAAKLVGEKAGTRAARKAIRVNPEAQRLVRDANLKAQAHVLDNEGRRGIRIKVATPTLRKGKKIPVGLRYRQVGGVTKATAAVGKQVGATARLLPGTETVRGAVRTTGAKLSGGRVRTASEVRRGVTRGGQVLRRAAVSSKLSGESLDREANAYFANWLEKNIDPQDHELFYRAYERKDPSLLPPSVKPEVVAKVKGAMDEADKIRHYQLGPAAGHIGEVPPVAVPHHVPGASKVSARRNRLAKTRVAAAERKLTEAREGRGVYQGRAEVGSRNVGGVRSEKAAERAAKRPRMIATAEKGLAAIRGEVDLPPAASKALVERQKKHDLAQQGHALNENVVKAQGKAMGLKYPVVVKQVEGTRALSDFENGQHIIHIVKSADRETAARQISEELYHARQREQGLIPKGGLPHISGQGHPLELEAKDWARRNPSKAAGEPPVPVRNYEQSLEDALKRLRTEEQAYAAGGYGVSQGRGAVKEAELELEAARAEAKLAAKEHGERKVTEKGAVLNQRRLQRESEAQQRAAKAYLPRYRESELVNRYGEGDEDDLRRIQGAMGGLGGANRGKSRKHLEPVDEVNQVLAPDAKLSTDVPMTVHAYLTDVNRLNRRGEFFRDLMNAGRPWRRGDALSPDEQLYGLGVKNGVFKLHPIDPDDAAAAGGEAFQKLAVFPKHFVEDAQVAARGVWHSGVWDRGTARWKSLATMTPGFVIRNVIGDSFMWASMRQGGVASMPAEMRAAWKAVRTLQTDRARLRDANFTFDMDQLNATRRDAPLHGASEHYDTVGDFLDLAAHEGIRSTGQVGGELSDIIHSFSGDARGMVESKYHRLRTWAGQFEDLGRLATFKNRLDQGWTPEAAGQAARDVHIDYRELSDFEKQLRRVAPFYTWTARTSPMIARQALERPAIAAKLQLAREEIAEDFGMTPEEMDEGLSEWQARTMPIRFSLGGQDKIVSFDLPLQLLNNVPLPIAGAEEQAFASMLDTMGGLMHPVAKLGAVIGLPAALPRQLSHAGPQQKEAPSWAQLAAKVPGLGNALGLKPGEGAEKGKFFWDWKRGEIASALTPGPAGTISRFGTGDKSPLEQVGPSLFGVRVQTPAGTAKVGAGEATKTRRALEAKQKAIRDRGGFGTREDQEITMQLKIAKAQERMAYSSAETPVTPEAAGTPEPTWGDVAAGRAKPGRAGAPGAAKTWGDVEAGR